VCTPFYEFSNGIWDSRTIIFHCTATFLFLALGSLFLRRL
jgi:hypothetical protein